MTDHPFMNYGEETITYERMMNALNPSDGGVESRHAVSPSRFDEAGHPAHQQDIGASPLGSPPKYKAAGVAPCPSEPFDLERFLAFVLNNMDTLVSHMTSVETAHEFIGQEDTFGSIKLCVDILASGYKERWPERSKLLRDNVNVIDLRHYRPAVQDGV